MIAIVKYPAGNIRSVMNALNRLGAEAILTDDPTVLRAADKVIFPGVGEASSAMRHLRETKLDGVLQDLKQPFLGICLGMQLMCAHSEENATACLNILPVNVRRFPPGENIPHMGWNNFIAIDDVLFDGIDAYDDMYYVHSYYVEVNAFQIATTKYILPFASAVRKDNFYGVQFHPEKSAEKGQRILQNFLNL